MEIISLKKFNSLETSKRMEFLNKLNKGEAKFETEEDNVGEKLINLFKDLSPK